jgi:hypothetical protein
MEHRYSNRHDINLKALIYKRGVPVAIGRIKNGSKQGLFVATDYADVKPHQKLELVVVIKRTPEQLKHYHLKTLVVHKSPSGLGLEMERHSGDLRLHDDFTALQQSKSVQHTGRSSHLPRNGGQGRRQQSVARHLRS